MASYHNGAYGTGDTTASYSYGTSNGAASYGSYGIGAATDVDTAAAGGRDTDGLRRRTAQVGSNNNYGNGTNGNSYNYDYDGKGKKNRAVVERLDFMFPKVDREFTVQTQSGGIATIIAYSLIVVLVLAEIASHYQQNRMELSTTLVDTSLGKRMRVNMNITFPSLACDDLHLDAIDVAGDSQINIEDTLKKRKLHTATGKWFSKEEIEVETNNHRKQQERREEMLRKELPDDYCGPCYGAHQEEGQCCQTCDDVIDAYTKKRWKSELLKYTAEQCVREGRDKAEPKKMTKGQGCNLSGFMTVNRVSGNFHIAMGEGIERDGRHIHTYVPEDSPNFNASHIIHQLSFGPEDGKEPLVGMTKIVTEQTGTTGLFQYFIKIVPTTYVGEAAKSLDGATPDQPNGAVETNRYFYTERFMPLMTDLLEDSHYDEDNLAAVHAGFAGGHHKEEHHWKQNAVLPGVFFIYEIYPFAVEIRKNSVPFTHLLIRCMATVGGVFTLAKWLDSIWYERTSGKRPRPSI
ncbi:endoplasmic reticulum vesicle transporter [Nitzschia inconspicua]|uniref:Endoplasmic reticulum vesicle transporter n=1 Tax=Nitzschia inconspicua TaxID=303405 RepID=A0A9K3KGQ4_9STRA|nr:endoplasmic reticulum vesicle transporter [Nitzschia inconspicua]